MYCAASSAPPLREAGIVEALLRPHLTDVVAFELKISPGCGDDRNEFFDSAVDGVANCPGRAVHVLQCRRDLLQEQHRPLGREHRILRRTFLTSATASCTRAIAGCERQPKTLRRKRAANCQRCLSAVAVSHPQPRRDLTRFGPRGVSGSLPRSSDHDAPSKGRRDKQTLARNPLPLHADSRLSAPLPPPFAPHAPQ
jgi:hypothetical protein